MRLGAPPFTREGRALLQGLGIEAVDRFLLLLDALNGRIAQISASLKRMCGEDPRARLLTTISGVGYYIALLLVAEIGDVNRFPDSESLCSYAGLVPSVWQRSGSTWHGGISREGSGWMRWILTQAVHAHLRHETNLTWFYRPARSEEAEASSPDGDGQEDAQGHLLDAQKRGAVPPRAGRGGPHNQSSESLTLNQG